MVLTFIENAWDDYLYWQKVDKRMVGKINELIKAIKRTPFEGIGKPEPLKCLQVMERSPINDLKMIST